MLFILPAPRLARARVRARRARAYIYIYIYIRILLFRTIVLYNEFLIYIKLLCFRYVLNGYETFLGCFSVCARTRFHTGKRKKNTSKNRWGRESRKKGGFLGVWRGGTSVQSRISLRPFFIFQKPRTWPLFCEN